MIARCGVAGVAGGTDLVQTQGLRSAHYPRLNPLI